MYAYFKYLPILLQFHPFDSILGMYGLVLFHLFYGQTIFVLADFAHIGIMSSIFALAANICFFIRLDETYKRYLKPAVDRRTYVRLVLYFRRNVLTMRYLFSTNRFYGPLLLSFLVTCLPMNISLLNAILLSKFNRTMTFFASGLYVAQLIAILVVHVVTARVSKQLHAPIDDVIGKYIRMYKCPLRARLQTALNIQTFKTSAKYGITYGPFGLISMSAFFKVSSVFFSRQIQHFLFLFSVCVFLFRVDTEHLQMSKSTSMENIFFVLFELFCWIFQNASDIPNYWNMIRGKNYETQSVNYLKLSLILKINY